MRGGCPTSDKQPRSRRQFTPEFKRVAVELVRTSGRPIAEIARELGVYDSTLGTGSSRTADERARLHQLERDDARLRMERDLRKRTSPSGSETSTP